VLICPSCAHENPDGQRFCGECGTKLEASPRREERKVITTLFCDLVGSTALGERLDAEDVSRLLHAYGQICRARIESHGGVIEKFIGDAVVGVFGVPFAHEDDPERAVRAALLITEDIGASELGIEVRIGVNTGEALVRLDVDPRSGEGFATGDSLNSAARLEAAAPVMGVAVGAETYRRSAQEIVYEELPAISAKGKAEPLQAWRAIAPSARVVDPGVDRTPFVGRDLELGVLIQSFERSRTRPSTEFVTVIAEPGMGKSRLVQELARHVDQLPEPVSWREGRCLPYGDGISFWALGEIVKAQAGILETDEQPTIATKLDQVIAEPDPRTRGWIKDRIAPLVGLDTDTAPPRQEEAFTAWRRFLEGIAAAGPTVLVVEDLHWADDAFVAFLTHLSERTAGLPLFVIVTARPEVEERHPSWPPRRRSTVLSLSPLADEDVVALIAGSLPEAGEELIGVVLERAGGSPLYAEQLAAMFAEQALPIAGGALDQTMIPAGVQALIAARIDALPPEPKRVLMHASVVGKTFWAGAVAALAEHEALDATLAELVRREFCRPVRPSSMEGDLEFGFWHALVRDVAYAELTKAERIRMHAATARWIAERTHGAMGEDAEIVVHHLDQAMQLDPSAPELETAPMQRLLGDALFAAGEAALRTEISNAVPYLERRLTLDSRDDAGDLATKLLLARARTATGDPGAARLLLDEVLRRSVALGDMETAVVAANELTIVHQFLGDISANAPMLDDLRREIGSEPSRALAEFMAIEIGTPEGWKGPEDALRRAGIAIEMAEGLGVAPPAIAIAVRGTCKVTLGDRSGEPEVDVAVDELLRQGRTNDAISSLYNLAFAFVGESPTEGLQRMDALIELTGRLGADSEVWVTRAGRLYFLMSLGRFDELTLEAGAIEAHARGSSDVAAKTFALLGLASIEVYRGGSSVDLAELEELVRGTLPTALWYVGAAAHARGDEASARALLVEAAADAQESLPGLAIACIDSGLSDLAEQLLGREVRDTSSDRAERALAEATLALQRGDLSSSADGFEEAAHAFEGLGMIVGEARALQALGACLLQMGRTDEGASSLHLAKSRWRVMRASVRVAEIEALLATVS
jgi:class 3 adenylate cyclase